MLFLTTSFPLSLSVPKLKIPPLINLIRDTLACEDRRCLHQTGAHLLRLLKKKKKDMENLGQALSLALI